MIRTDKVKIIIITHIKPVKIIRLCIYGLLLLSRIRLYVHSALDQNVIPC